MKKKFSFAKLKTTTKVLAVLFLACTMLALGSCTTLPKTPPPPAPPPAPTMVLTQILSPDYEPTNENGYIYGSFFIEKEKEGLENLLPISIVVQNTDTTEKYAFVLKNAENKVFQISAVPPGNYRVDTVEYLDGVRVEVFEEFTIDGYQRDFVVQVNTAVYLGNFSGSIRFQEFGPENIDYTTWRLYTPTYNYDTTTVAIKEKYPLLTEPPITFVSNMEGFSPKNNNKGMEKIISIKSREPLFSPY